MGKPEQKQASGSARKFALNAITSRSEEGRNVKVKAQNNKNRDTALASPQTCCSHCKTVFEVSLELLSTSDTRVRCGKCLSIFDALANLREIRQAADSKLSRPRHDNLQGEGEATVDRTQAKTGRQGNNTSSLPNVDAAALAGLINDTASLDVTYSDFDLFSSDAGLPDVRFFDGTQGVQGFQFDDLPDIGDETFSDTLFAQDATVDARLTLSEWTPSRQSSGIAFGDEIGFINDNTYHEPLIFNYQDVEPEARLPTSLRSPGERHFIDGIDNQKQPAASSSSPVTRSRIQSDLRVAEASSTNVWLLRGGLFAIVLIIAGSLYGYRQRGELLQNDFLRPILSTACEILLCRLPSRIDLNALRAVDRSVVLHPTVANALIIKFGIVNQAEFSQPHPVLEIRLTDRAGRLVVINRFLPTEYLRGWQPGDVLDVGKRLDIGLVVEDPGNTAMSFELDFHASR